MLEPITHWFGPETEPRKYRLVGHTDLFRRTERLKIGANALKVLEKLVINAGHVVSNRSIADLVSGMGSAVNEQDVAADYVRQVRKVLEKGEGKLAIRNDRSNGYYCVWTVSDAPVEFIETVILDRMAASIPDLSPPLLPDLRKDLDRLTRMAELRYLDGLIEKTDKAPLYADLGGLARIRTSVERIKTKLDDVRSDRTIEFLRYQARRGDVRTEAEQRKYTNILDAFTQVKRAAVLGGPGSGKSTTLQKLAAHCATIARESSAAAVPLLAELAFWTGDEPLAEFLRDYAPEIGWAVHALSESGRLILLLDGLNEVPSGKWTKKAHAVMDFVDSLAPMTSVFVSCRIEDYPGVLDSRFDTLTLEPLSPPRVRATLRHLIGDESDRFFWQLAGNEALEGVFEKWSKDGYGEDEFWNEKFQPRDWEWTNESTLRWKYVRDPRSLIHLAANPFMLTMLLTVSAEWGQLPANRGELFSLFITALMFRENVSEEESVRLMKGLTELAWLLQDLVPRVTGAFVLYRGGIEQHLIGPAMLRRAIGAAILNVQGEWIRFGHQLLQEHFAALALGQKLEQVSATEFWSQDRWWVRTGWEETVMLLAGLHGEDCSAVIRWLAETQPEVASQCIAASGAGLIERASMLTWLKEIWSPRLLGETNPAGRAAIGRALGKLGLDTRNGVLAPGGIPEIDWIEIPAGPFVYHDKHRMTERFRIARYPVTNEQWDAFLDALDGYRDDRWWTGLITPIRQPAAPRWTEANHPRETVSWHEAMAFCAWLSYKLEVQVSLPTEAQWVRATSGNEGMKYPWGHKFLPDSANVREGHSDSNPSLERTTAVGIYPSGASAEGVMDLIGNVWEWCLDGPPTQSSKDHDRELKILRGRAWFDYRGLPSEVDAIAPPSSHRDPGTGFRLVSMW